MINTVALELDTYTSRTPRKNRYYRLVEDNFEQLEKVWEQKYRQKYGYWRPYVTDVIYKFLDCGDPHMDTIRTSPVGFVKKKNSPTPRKISHLAQRTQQFL